jgi:AcrR family transcriptional regulator
MGRKPGRPRAGEEPLSRERILGAALRIVDEGGAEALRMRGLAGALGVDPMAIYRHLPGKAAIMAGLAELVFAEMPAPPELGHWRERVRAVALAYIERAIAHPNLVLHMIVDPEVAAGVGLVVGEALFAALSEAGLAPAQVVRAADLIVDYLNGYALAARSGRLGQPGEREAIRAQLVTLPDERYPTLRRVFAAVRDDQVAADVAIGLEIILAGIEAQAATERR